MRRFHMTLALARMRDESSRERGHLARPVLRARCPRSQAKRLIAISAMLALLALIATPARVAHVAAPPPIVVTGTTFPAGLGLGVAADPLGLQAALWTPLVGFDDHLRPMPPWPRACPPWPTAMCASMGGGHAGDGPSQARSALL